MNGHRRDDDQIYTISEISRIIRKKHDLPSQCPKLAVQHPNDCGRFKGQNKVQRRTRCKANFYTLVYLPNTGKI